ncbi:unnamed protein product [Callosobruchus maculatus]|uniref:Uncharacterized protein n=1 Tax=Callosobruchus maculatus TaxID=64391 RepID=A0A653C3S1_CALMS|nr:unnamed protein product [Callosobruchus maculatus]
MDASAEFEIRSSFRMLQQMSIKIMLCNCFKGTSCTFMQFTSNRCDKLWMFSNHMLIQ